MMLQEWIAGISARQRIRKRANKAPGFIVPFLDDEKLFPYFANVNLLNFSGSPYACH